MNKHSVHATPSHLNGCRPSPSLRTRSLPLVFTVHYTADIPALSNSMLKGHESSQRMWWVVLAWTPRLRHGTHCREETHLCLVLQPCEMFLYYTSISHRALSWQVTGNGQFWVLSCPDQVHWFQETWAGTLNRYRLLIVDLLQCSAHRWCPSARFSMSTEWVMLNDYQFLNSPSIPSALIYIRLLLMILADLVQSVTRGLTSCPWSILSIQRDGITPHVMG